MEQQGRSTNVFSVLAEEQKLQRRAAKKAEHDERKRIQKETADVQLQNAKWADVSDSSYDDEPLLSSSESSEESVVEPMQIELTFSKPVDKKEKEVPTEKAGKTDDDFLNSIVADCSPKQDATKAKKAKGKKTTVTKFNIDEDDEVIAARAEVAKAEEELKKSKPKDTQGKQANRAKLQKAQNALRDVERRATSRATNASRAE
eukprot:GHVH01006373.1.p1 GENE.GHVH01006373.1~~GHVH01006373.1.p1  ORF type:complete len:203 (+),score=49.18 GHVH01006373.1:500-1108(+)